jgi:hypothetical protein
MEKLGDLLKFQCKPHEKLLGGINVDEKVHHYDIRGHKITCCPIQV